MRYVRSAAVDGSKTTVRTILLLAALAAIPVSVGSAQVQIVPPSPEDRAAAADAQLFASHDPLELVLKSDFRRLRRDRDQDEDQRPGRLSFTGAAGDTVTLDVQVRTRGNFRLRRRTCNFPPLRLNFKKRDTRGTVFAGEDKLKLVVHCQDDKEEYEQYVLQEYLIYRAYNLFTDKSFRVRLARITYVDTGSDKEALTRWAFLKEDEDRMAARNGMDIFEMQGLHPENTEYELITLLYVFQYLIGNTDWSVSKQHNIELMADETQVPYAVPFDFDWSGIVGAPYAKPDPSLPIRNVRDRFFSGYCRGPDELAPVFAEFNAKKDELYALYHSQPGLDEEYRKKTLEYLDEFYETINDPRKVDRRLVRGCRRM